MRRQINEFLALKDQVVRSWSGVEMAVRGGDGPAPEFAGQDVPCRHLSALHARTDTGDTVTIATYQDDCLFGLRIELSAGPGGDDDSHGYRRRALPELPTGLIRAVSIDLDGDVLAEVGLEVDGRHLLLVAGEADEDFEGRLVWRRLDESVLAFTDPNTVEQLQWASPRRRLQRIT
ncbi:hypothetical protein GA0070214_103494 [Micromonospora chaiyaphumensis]|uniref:Uncharacterized protein n=2 Tax=Micromonospora chaiyaphumensis TaxID=307119 RepID=A0A1C4WEI3_9ACTN|nr:hypothetical protein GA0070214_103494 [Micromonospora chaiyaphumensis]